MDRPLVSVLMTAYNREDFISEAIKSVLSSSYQNFELVIVDDASTDNTVRIAKEYESFDDRIKVHVNQSNLGDYPNRNMAASYASGTYLKYVDSDDRIFQDTLTVLVDAMERFPEAALGLISREMDLPSTEVHCYSPKESYHKHFYLDGFLENGPISAIIKTISFRKIGGFSGKRMIGDNELWLKLALCHPVICIPFTENLIFWRTHSQQETSNGMLYYTVNALFMYAEILSSQNCPFSFKEKQIIFRRMKNRKKLSIIKFAFKSGKLSQALSMYQHVLSAKVSANI